MNCDLPIAAFALAGPGSEHAPAGRIESLPPPGTKRRGGRAALLAVELTRRTLHADVDLASASTIFGTALGCLTETQAFVEHMVAAAEGTPKPRAFASSVHNAIASKVALEFGARGECQTFVQGEVSFAHALFAAATLYGRRRDPILVGAIDEANDYVRRGLDACGSDVTLGEGGAVLRIGDPALARIRHVAYARPADLREWLAAPCEDAGTILTVPTLTGAHAAVPDSHPAAQASVHAALLATVTALAVGVLADEVPPRAVGCDDRPTRITLVGQSRLGDAAIIQLERG